MGAFREEAQITSSGSRSADRTKKLANISTHNGTTCDNQVPRPPWSHSRRPYGRTDSRPDAVCLYISLRQTSASAADRVEFKQPGEEMDAGRDHHSMAAWVPLRFVRPESARRRYRRLALPRPVHRHC